MDIKIVREELLGALQSTVSVVERRQSLPVLGNVLLAATDDQLELRATDLEMQIAHRISVQCTEKGRITTPARKLYDICRGLSDAAEIAISLQEGRLRVQSGRSRFVLSTLPADDFPEIGTTTAELEMTLPAGVLKSLIKRTDFAMAQQDVRYYLNGLLLEVSAGLLRAVATDGHRLAVSEEDAELTVEGLKQFIVPRKTVVEMARLFVDETAPVRLGLAAGQLTLAVGDITLSSKLIDGSYPEYRRVIPTNGDRRMLGGRETVRQALVRAAILSNEKFRGVRLKFSAGTMRIEAQNPEQEEAVEEVAVEFTGEDLEIGFNVSYIVDALNALDGDQFVLELHGPDSSGLIYDPEKPRHRYVVMPMRL